MIIAKTLAGGIAAVFFLVIPLFAAELTSQLPVSKIEPASDAAPKSVLSSPNISKAEQEAVIKVGGVTMNGKQIAAILSGLDTKTRDDLKKNPGLASEIVARQAFQIAILQEAAARGWAKRPEIAKAIDVARDQVVLQSFLDDAVKVPVDYPPEPELQKAYDLNQQKFLAPRQYHIMEIFLPVVKPEEKDPVGKKAQEIVQKARAPGADFAMLAPPQATDAPKRDIDLGWVAETQIIPEAKSAVLGLQKNDVSDALFIDAPGEDSDGWYVLKLIDTKPAGLLPLAEVKPDLAQSLRQQKRNELIAQYANQLLQKKQFEINQVALQNLIKDIK